MKRKEKNSIVLQHLFLQLIRFLFLYERDNNLVQLIETQWSGGADVMERFPDGGSDKSFLQRDAESSQWEAILSVAPPGKKYIYVVV